MPWLDFSNNKISGDLSLFSGVHSDQFDVSRNQVSGELPTTVLSNQQEEFYSGVSLVVNYLDVSGNQISGELPKALLSNGGHFLNVSRNQLRGHVPEPYGDDWILDVSWNRFEGPLPRFSTSTFSSLVLSRNNFTGPMPSGLKKSLGLTILDMSFNNFSGKIPAFLGNFMFLEVVDLTSNRFIGSLPEKLGNCWSLQHLRVGNNFLHGQIPTSIGNFGIPHSLRTMTMAHNALEGSIPSTLGNCINLALLDLSHNNLTGTLPSALEKLFACLLVFSVASNRLAGPFPGWIVSASFGSLQVLDLSNNYFHGVLPTDYSKLSGFINGTNANNNDTLYEESIEISAKGGNLTITSFVTVWTSFDVSSNSFSGNIPKKLGDLRALRGLKLSGNAFLGKIPTELSNLHNLESLDLSQNFLTGSIPSELNDIKQLSYLNVSSNLLTGIIPTGGQFNTFNESSFWNNSGLCGFPLPLCQNPSVESPTKGIELTHHHYWRQKLLDWISLDAFLLGFGSSCGVVGLTFLLSKSARSLLYVPRRKARRVYHYRKPYGAYMPKS